MTKRGIEREIVHVAIERTVTAEGIGTVGSLTTERGRGTGREITKMVIMRETEIAAAVMATAVEEEGRRTERSVVPEAERAEVKVDTLEGVARGDKVNRPVHNVLSVRVLLCLVYMYLISYHNGRRATVFSVHVSH